MNLFKRPGYLLRTRLLFNLAPFVAILIAVGGYAIILFSSIPGEVDVTVKGNYQSVVAAQNMKLALTRMQQGVLMAMDDSMEGYKGLGAAFFEKNRKVFDENLEAQIGNAKSSQERDVNRRLRNIYNAFATAGADILKMENPVEQEKSYRLNLESSLPAVDRLLDQIILLNENAILRPSQQPVERITRRFTRLMIIGVVVALLMTGYAFYKLARTVLGPIQSLTRATRELGKGNLDQVVQVRSGDELGELADSFNKMAEQLRNYRQSTSEKIVRLHRTMEATLASFPDPVFVLNREGEIDLMNVAATEMTRLLELKNELPEHVRETAHKALAGGESFLPHSFKEVVSYRLDGKEKFFLPRVLAMRNEEGVFIGVAVVLYDVTRFRLMDDAKSNLVSTVSHEIRTPLTSVRMALHLLLERTVGALTPRQNDLLVAARDESERLLRILNDLLDLTRLEEGNTDLRKERVSPAELVHNVADITREAVATRDLTLTCKAEPGLPQVLVDPQRINHVFTNLITNAIKYSPRGGEIVLEASRTGEREVQFSVIDRGPGVPEEHQDRIFDRFYRVPGQSKKTGAGLGLSIAREIVVAHGGRIGVRATPGEGSEFYFVLGEADGEASR